MLTHPIRNVLFALCLVSFILGQTVYAQPSTSTTARPLAAVGAGTYNDDHPDIVYEGAWTDDNNASRAIANDQHYTSGVGAKVRLTFSGTRISYFHTMASNRGTYKVYIDGTLVASKHARASSVVLRQVGETYHVSSGIHTIEVVNSPQESGTLMDLDAFVVDIATVGTGGYDDNNAQIRYIGQWQRLNTAYMYAGIAGDFARFTYTGCSLTLRYYTYSNGGTAAVTIDGVLMNDINTFGGVGSGFWSRQITYNSLGCGTHILHIAAYGSSSEPNGGTEINIDYLSVQ